MPTDALLTAAHAALVTLAMEQHEAAVAAANAKRDAALSTLAPEYGATGAVSFERTPKGLVMRWTPPEAQP